MKSPLFYLLLGIVWYGVWTYHLFLLLERELFIDAIFDFFVLFPIGISFIYDYIVRRRETKSYLDLPLWNTGDYAFFISGFFAILTLALISFSELKNETLIQGILVAFIAIMHYFRRRLRILGHL